MVKLIDIFRVNEKGELLWVEPATTVDDAKARIQELGVREPGEYLIFDHECAEKIMLRADGSENV